jgi:hypothetical protein
MVPLINGQIFNFDINTKNKENKIHKTATLVEFSHIDHVLKNVLKAY